MRQYAGALERVWVFTVKAVYISWTAAARPLYSRVSHRALIRRTRLSSPAAPCRPFPHDSEKGVSRAGIVCAFCVRAGALRLLHDGGGPDGDIPDWFDAAEIWN